MSLFDNIFAAKQTTITTDQDVTNNPPVDPTLKSGPINPVLKQDISVLSHLDPRSTQVITAAYQEAKRVKASLIEPEHILLALLQDRDIFKTLQESTADPAKITRDLQAKLIPGSFEGDPTLSESSKQILEAAYNQVKTRKVEFVTPEDILLAMLDTTSPVAENLKTQGVEKAKIEEKFSKDPQFKSGKRSALKEFGIDLTEAAAQGKLDPVAGREEETRRVIHILIRRTKNNPIVIGEAGTGKTAIVEGLAQAIAQNKVPPELQGKKIIQLEVSALVAGASHRGEFEERLQSVVKETMASGGQVILFIDEIHTLIGAGETGGALDASNILKPYLSRGQMQVIGATTTAEYRRYFEKDRAFERRFQAVMCDEPNEEKALEMIKVLQPKYEAFHKVTFSPESLQAAVKLSKRYIGERFLPDKAIDLMDEAASELRLQQSGGKRSDTVVKEEDIQTIVSGWTGIPITKLTEKESDKLLHLEELIHKKYINQERAVKAVAEAVRRGRIGLANMNRPIASFIFLGPTGTGKTEIAKILAEIMFGSQNNMIRLDMSEYMEKHEVAKLIGAPPGYVGYEEGGQLTEAVRKKPYSIVLLDEIEKAHPDVFNIMLQLLEDGRMTDNKGNTISFKNTVVIATSNVGSVIIREHLMKASEEKSKQEAQKTLEQKAWETTTFYQGIAAQTPPKLEEKKPEDKDAPAQFVSGPSGKSMDDISFRKLSKLVIDELNKFFKPEFLNRFDEIVLFEPLTQDNMIEIAKLGVESVRKMLSEQGVGIQVSQTALAQLAKDGYDPVYGARPLRRLIQRSVENPLAIYLINRSVEKGDTVIVDYDPKQDKFVFNRSRQQTSQVPTNGTLQASNAQDSNGPQVQNPAQSGQPTDAASANGINPLPSADAQLNSQQNPVADQPAVQT
ncbi:ATP-dependent Clp protease ATP-binding subunit [Candidatus Daviesbacteria bacterium]|nr:ATP-dependent Clp protease ATP-binding subunit [Candidatus Daviesbacteria bacterium]